MAALLPWGTHPSGAQSARQSAPSRQRLEAALSQAAQARGFAINVRNEVERLGGAPIDGELAQRIESIESALRRARALAGDRAAGVAALEQAERQVIAQTGELQRVQRDLAARLSSLRQTQQVLRGAIDELRAPAEARLQGLPSGAPGTAELRKWVDLASAVDDRADVPRLEQLRSGLSTALAATAPASTAATPSRPAAEQPRPAAVQPQSANALPRGPALEPARAQTPSSRPATAAQVPAVQTPAPQATQTENGEGSSSADAVPLSLQEAARAVFAADYERALRLLETVPFGDPRVETARQLLSSAASYALYSRRGEGDPHLIEAARTHGIAFVQAAPGFDFTGLPFSPRFVAFLRSLPAPAPAALASPSN